MGKHYIATGIGIALFQFAPLSAICIMLYGFFVAPRKDKRIIFSGFVLLTGVSMYTAFFTGTTLSLVFMDVVQLFTFGLYLCEDYNGDPDRWSL